MGKHEMDNFEKLISKPNRRKQLEPKKHSTIVGPPPPTGIHEEDRKERDRRRNLAIKKFIK